MRCRVLIAVGAVAVVAVLAAVYSFDPAGGEFPFPRCMFKAVTGWDCPGCGSTRALHALLHCRIADAWGANPAVFFAVPLIALCFAAEVPRFSRLRRVLFSRAFVAAIILAALLWTITRNL